VIYRTILADPPWPQQMSNAYLKTKQHRPTSLPYPTLTVDQIKAMPVGELAETGCHLWLWVTNRFLRDGFDVIDAWGFKFLAPITWVKQSGIGNYFIHRTEHLLFGYKGKCQFNAARYVPNVYHWPQNTPGNHSRKPPGSYELIESISDERRLELFARQSRPGWHVWGNEVRSDVRLKIARARAA